MIEPDNSHSGGFSSGGNRQHWGPAMSDETFTLELKFQAPDLVILPELNRDIVSFAGSIASQLPLIVGSVVQLTGEALLTASVEGRPIRSLIENRALLPWLPWEDRVIMARSQKDLSTLTNPGRFHFDTPLVGQRLHHLNLGLGEMLLAPKDRSNVDPGRTATFISFTLTSISFEQGSIKGVLKGIQTGAASLSLFLGLAYIEPQVTKLVNHETAVYQAHGVVAKLVGEQNVPFCEARLSFDGLKEARERYLNYREKNIDSFERHCRIAQNQALLAVALNIDLPIDGVAGPRTNEAERAFAHKHNLHCTDCPEFRGQLAQVIEDLIARKEGQSKGS